MMASMNSTTDRNKDSVPVVDGNKVFLVRSDVSYSVEGVTLSRETAIDKCVKLNAPQTGYARFRVYEMTSDNFWTPEQMPDEFQLVYSTWDEYNLAVKDKAVVEVDEASFDVKEQRDRDEMDHATATLLSLMI